MPTRAAMVSRKVGKAGLIGRRPAYSQAATATEARRSTSGWREDQGVPPPCRAAELRQWWPSCLQGSGFRHRARRGRGSAYCLPDCSSGLSRQAPSLRRRADPCPESSTLRSPGVPSSGRPRHRTGSPTGPPHPVLVRIDALLHRFGVERHHLVEHFLRLIGSGGPAWPLLFDDRRLRSSRARA